MTIQGFTYFIRIEDELFGESLIRMEDASFEAALETLYVERERLEEESRQATLHMGHFIGQEFVAIKTLEAFGDDAYEDWREEGLWEGLPLEDEDECFLFEPYRRSG